METTNTSKNAKNNTKLFICEICDYVCSKESGMKKHFDTAKHISRATEIDQEIENTSIHSKKFLCEKCDFNCMKKGDFKRHLMSIKHNNTINEINIFCIRCNKQYKTNSGLWKHQKTCLPSENIIISNEPEHNNTPILVDSSNNEFKMLTSLVLELVKSNTELQKQMLEVCKNTNINNNNNTTINSNSYNKTFNLQFFLNEQCKDAMNLSDFVKSVQLTLPDLEKVDEEGYVNGMSNLIISKLNELDIYKRPVHCSDSKRDTMHVKDEDKWEREDPEFSKLTVAVKDIEKKNFLLLNDYKEKYPDCLNLESIHNDKYLHMMMTLAASGENEYKKVVKKVAKEVAIEKETV